MFQKVICLSIVPLLLANLGLSLFAHSHKSIDLDGSETHGSQLHLHLSHHSQHDSSHHHDHEHSDKNDPSQTSIEATLCIEKPVEHDSDAVYITELVSSSQTGNWLSDTFWDQLSGSSFLQISLLNEDGSKHLNRPQNSLDSGTSAHCPLYLRTLSLRI